MKNVIFTAAAVGFLSAVGASFVTQSLMSERQSSRTASVDTAATGATDLTPIFDRLDEMEQRFENLSMQPATVAETRSSVNGADALALAALRDEIEELKSANRLVAQATEKGVDMSFANQVEAVMELKEERERTERRERREQAMNERMEERLAMVKKELNLSGYQVDELRRIETESRTKRDELMTAARENDDWGNMRETMRTLRDEQETSLVDLFGQELYDQYDELVGRGGLTGGDRGGRGAQRGGGGRGGR